MPSITLTPISSTGAVPGVGAAGTPLSATQIPPALAALPGGTLIRGFVLNRDAAGNPILRSDVGDFLLESEFFLKIGSDVVVKVDSGGSRFHASIVSVDGRTPQEAATLQAHGEDADVIVRPGQPPPRGGAEAPPARAAHALPAEEEPKTPPPLTLTGTLVRPPAAAPPAPGLTPGAQLLLRVLNVALPGPAAPPPAQAPSAVSAPQTAPPPQYGAYTRAASHESPPPALPAAAPPAASAILQATVLHTTETGEPLLQTPYGAVRVQHAPPFPPGSQLQLEVLQLLPPAAASAASAAELASGWQTLRQIAAALTALDEEAATRFLRMALPSSAYGAAPAPQNLYPSAQNLGSGMAFFISALTGGNFRGWLGERAAALLEGAGHANLLSRAEEEFGRMKTLYQPANPQSWQAMFLPILAEGEMRPLRLYVKRDRKEKGAKQPAAQADTRFVIEMELSFTGPLQLDGFVRKRESATQFDLIIRSHTPFSGEAKRDIQAIYAGIGEATGYTGLVQFQETQDFPIKPLDEILSEQHREVVV